MRTGVVRTANSVSSCAPTRRSDDAGGAATSDGASARGGAGMNEDERGRSPCENQAAVAGPFEVTRVRERRRFLSSPAGAATRATAGAATPALTAPLAPGFCLVSAAFSAFAGLPREGFCVAFAEVFADVFAAGWA